MPDFKLNPQEARVEWVKALRSGQYEQTDGRLRKGDEFCCLGVACDLYAKLEGKGQWSDNSTRPGYVGCIEFGDGISDVSTGELPEAVQLWLNVNATGDFSDSFKGYYSLVDLNDEAHASFDEIANVIEGTSILKPTPATEEDDDETP